MSHHYRPSNNDSSNRVYSGFSVRGQKSTDSKGQSRPISAGSTRRGHGNSNSNSNNNFLYGRSNTGATNNVSSGLLGMGYASQRPSSAGHSRPSRQQQLNTPDINVNHGNNVQQPQIYVPQGHNAGSTPIQTYQQVLHQQQQHLLQQQQAYLASGVGSGGGSSSGHARPKSAGAVRRNDTPNLFNNNNMTAQQQQYLQQHYQQQIKAQQTDHSQQYQQQQQTAANYQLQEQMAQQQQQQPQKAARPLSANATGQTASRNQFSNNAAPDHWSNAYKVHYGYVGEKTPESIPTSHSTGGGAAATTNSGGPTAEAISQRVEFTGGGGGAPSSSSSRPSSATITGTRLRTAVDLSHQYENGKVPPTAASGSNTQAATAAGSAPTVRELTGTGGGAGGDGDGALEAEEDVGGLDAAVTATGLRPIPGQKLSIPAPGTATATKATPSVNAPNIQNVQPTNNAADGGDDTEEMDGKPLAVYESRSRPEVSTAGGSQSLELAGGVSATLAGVSAVDVRNSSIDSFSDVEIQVGLTTVPNQFCTKRDAIELKKLLALSQGTRGGIVPSSSAVMDMYMVGKVVGVGSYGKVRAAWHRLTASKVAIKTYDKSKLKDPAHWKRVHSEIKIMEQISHPRIARMYEAVETPKRMHLIMECLDGGNLCSYVKAKRRLSEDESRRIFFQILQAIEYLHGLGVSHRDVKLENVLFADDKDIKVIDFGFSTVCQPGKKLKVFCGTPSYMAPEIVRRAEYDGKPVDMWSMGILLYALLCGCFPFRAKAYPDLYRRIARGTFPIPEELSAPVKDLLNQLLTVDADQRITAHAALRHPWLQVQLVNAPNIEKMRLEITILISDKPGDDLDEQVIGELEKFGMGREEVIRLVLTKTHSSLATLYYLLLDTLVKRRKALGRSGASSQPRYSSGSQNQQRNGRPYTGGATRSSSGNNNINPVVTGSNTLSSAQRIKGGAPVNGNDSGTGTGVVGILRAKEELGGDQQLQQQQQTHNEILLQQQMAENARQAQLQNAGGSGSGAPGGEFRFRPRSASALNRGGVPQRPSSALASHR